MLQRVLLDLHQVVQRHHRADQRAQEEHLRVTSPHGRHHVRVVHLRGHRLLDHVQLPLSSTAIAHVQIRKGVHDVLDLVQDLAIRRVLRGARLQILNARLDSVVDAAQRHYLVIDLAITPLLFLDLVVDGNDGRISDATQDVLHAGFLDRQSLDADIQLAEHALSLLSVLQVIRL